MIITAKDLINKAGDLVTLPNIYLRLREVVEDVRASNRDVAALISEDAGLAARILRIANSSFYGFPSNVDTITRAVTVIGTRQITDVVMATTVLDMFDGVPEDKASMQDFWHHSISCGVAARVLATYRREMNVERFFVAGLLHDIGKLVMFLSLGERYWEIIRFSEEADVLLNVAEKEQLGFDHSDVGSLLLKEWELPKHTIDAVKYHHNYSDDGYIGVDAAVVHVAEVVASAIYASEGGEIMVPPLYRPAWDAVALPVSIFAPAVKQIKRQYDDAVELISPGNNEIGYACA